MPDAIRRQHYITSGYIQVIVGEQHIRAYWAHPHIGGPFPGLVLLHDDRGLSAHIRAMVHRLAEVGYYVAAPDLFEGKLPDTQMQANQVEEQYLMKGTANAEGVLDAIRTHHKCNEKMAVVGWDFGGTLVYNLAMNHDDIMAAVAFYGNPMRFMDRIGKVKCPLLAIFGSKDEIDARYENLLREKLIRSGEPHEVIVYPNARHGFYNDSLDVYDEDAAEDAWIQMLAFLETHQGKPPAPDAAHSGTFDPGGIY